MEGGNERSSPVPAEMKMDQSDKTNEEVNSGNNVDVIVTKSDIPNKEAVEAYNSDKLDVDNNNENMDKHQDQDDKDEDEPTSDLDASKDINENNELSDADDNVDDDDDDLPPAPEGDQAKEGENRNGLKDEEVPPPPPDTEPPEEEPPSYNDVQDDEGSEPERDPTPEPPKEPTPESSREPTPEPPREPTPEPEPVPVVITSAPSHNYHPRLCHVTKWADFQGYGFNLHGEKDVQGQYIGAVDDGSPAESAGIKNGDRIIEVNGDNIESSSHKEVIMKIKSGGEETTLLVVDKETDKYYKNNGIQITADLPEVIAKSTEKREAPAMMFSPRLCHIIKWSDFNGYGFNLHAEKERGGQKIGKIDDNSPAQDGGLRDGDRIVEVNGVNVEDETHRQVINRIKEGGDETKLLVVDVEADNYYKSRGITVKSSMSEVKHLQTTRRTPAMSGVTNGDSRPTSRTAPVANSAPSVQANGDSGDFLSMKVTAKEMRERIASKKKNDPKHKANLDFKSKYDMFQKL